MKSRRRIETNQAPAAVGPYSQAVWVDGWVYCSGQIPLDPVTGQLVSGGIEAEARRVLENLKAVLAAAGCGLDDVVKTTIYLTNLDDFSRVNEVYAEYFGASLPARATVGVARLPRGAAIEIEAVARPAAEVG